MPASTEESVKISSALLLVAILFLLVVIAWNSCQAVFYTQNGVILRVNKLTGAVYAYSVADPKLKWQRLDLLK
jgi:hypothetical protein